MERITERIHFDKAAHKNAYRTYSTSKVEFDTTGTTGASGLNLTGYFVVYNVLSTDRGGYLARIPPDSMVLPDYDVVALYNHNDDHILGRESNNSLQISTDNIGIKISLSLADTQFNRDLFSQIIRKDIKGLSFGMYSILSHQEIVTIRPEDATTDTGLTSLIGQDVEVEVYDKWLLDEITVTGIPAFPQTTLEPLKASRAGASDSKLIEVYATQAKLLGLRLD